MAFVVRSRGQGVSWAREEEGREFVKVLYRSRIAQKGICSPFLPSLEGSTENCRKDDSIGLNTNEKFKEHREDSSLCD